MNSKLPKVLLKATTGAPILSTIGNVAISTAVNILVTSIFEIVSARIKKGKKNCLVNCKK